MRIVAFVAGLVVTVAGLPSVAAAEPEDPVSYPAGASANRAHGRAFDTCAAPSLSALRAWDGASPYRTVNVYFGGINRSCRQSNLDSSWVSRATTMGWRLLPTYVGHQPSCVYGSKGRTFTASTATLRGAADGRDAISKASALGMRPGSALYADVEHYNPNVASCRTAVRRYVSAWTKTLHNAGYLAGVYVHQRSGLRDLSDSYYSSRYARPDAVWMARWDNNASLSGWSTAPNWHWAYRARVKQYRGPHYERHGGLRIHVDSNSINAPVATVVQRYRVTSRTGLNARSGPGTSYSVEGGYGSGARVPVICQTRGQKVGGTRVWNRLSDGAWVTDRYVATLNRQGFSSRIPRCTYPAQVTASALNARTGPGISHSKEGGLLTRGALAYIVCQDRGSKVQTSRVWNKLIDGRWVSDYYVATRSDRGFSAPIPRCP